MSRTLAGQHRPRISPWHILAFSLSGALMTGAALTNVLVPSESRGDAPRVVQFDRQAPCETCWTREATDAWMESGQDGAFVRL